MTNTSTTITPLLLNNCDVAAALGLSTSTVDDLTKTAGLPCIRMAGRGDYGGTYEIRRYELSAVQQWIARQRSISNRPVSSGLPPRQMAPAAAARTPVRALAPAPRPTPKPQQPPPARKKVSPLMNHNTMTSDPFLEILDARERKLRALIKAKGGTVPKDLMRATAVAKSTRVVDPARAAHLAAMDRAFGLDTSSGGVRVDRATGAQTFSALRNSVASTTATTAAAPQATSSRSSEQRALDDAMGTGPRAPSVRREGASLVFSAR